MKDLDRRVHAAVRHFWLTRDTQQKRQKVQGRTDQGTRGSATGGAHLDGFLDLLTQVIVDAGIPAGAIHRDKAKRVLPGYFRPAKEWDLLIVVENQVIAIVELKSHAGSFGNNYNNRTEEALGNATDLWTAFEAGAFRPSSRPWLGYFMLLEERYGKKSSMDPLKDKKYPHFDIFQEFKGTSYSQRYELFCLRLLRRRLYDGACFLLSERDRGRTQGAYRCPNEELGVERFARALAIRAREFAKH